MRRGVRTGKVGGVAPEIPQSAEARSYSQDLAPCPAATLPCPPFGGQCAERETPRHPPPEGEERRGAREGPEAGRTAVHPPRPGSDLEVPVLVFGGLGLADDI